MKSILNAVAAAAALTCPATMSTARADVPEAGIELVPFGRNGARYLLHPPAIAPDVAGAFPVVNGAIEVPIDYRIRPTCIVGQQVRVAHRDGVGQVIPSLSVDWEGVADPAAGRFPGLFKVGVDIIHADGTSDFTEVIVRANSLDKIRPVYARSDGRVIYQGELSNGPDGYTRIALGVDVRQGDFLTPHLCDFGPGVAVSVSALVVQSVPTE